MKKLGILLIILAFIGILYAASAQTPAPQAITVPLQALQAIDPLQVQAKLTQWIQLGTFAVTALAGFAMFLLAKINEVKGQADRNGVRLDMHGRLLTHVALQTPDGSAALAFMPPMAPQPPASAPAPSGPNISSAAPLGSVMAAILMLLWAGCATNTANQTTNERNAGVNAAGAAALRDAAQIIGQVAVTSLTNAVAKDTQKGASAPVTNLEQSGVQALYSVTGKDPVDLSNIFTQFSAGKARQTAAELAKIQAAAGASPQVAQAAAAVISTVTGAPPAK